MSLPGFLARSAALAAAASLLALLAPQQAGAQMTYEPSLVRRLPEYCKYTQLFRDRISGGNNPEEIERWSQRMGKTFIHMHHYCFGLMNSDRAAFLATTPLDKTHNLNNSILEYDYVIEKAPQEFAWLPEILTKKGESLVRLDRGAEGALEFERAIKLSPEYTLPYAALSDYYKESGQIAKARQALERGLAVAPDSRLLLRRKTDLDRKGASGTARKPAALSRVE